MTKDGEITNPDPGGGGSWCAAFTEELQAAVESVTGNGAHPILSADLALDALKVCLAEAESIRTGNIVSI
jgi:hypothetical protein